MSGNKLSIVTICYNSLKVKETCESIVNQTWQNFEWIVIDGGSEQSTINILGEYKNRINIFVSEKDNGIYDAINKGIIKASGEWINFMNAGDSFASNDILQKVFEDESLSTAEIVYGDFNYVTEEETHNYTTPNKLSVPFLCLYCLNHQSTFFKSDLFKQFGLYNLDYKLLSDCEKNIIFFLNGCKFKHLNLTIANYDAYGISSRNTALSEKEEAVLLCKYGTKKEIADNLFKLHKKIRLFQKFTVATIKTIKASDKKRLSILGIPILKY